MIPPSTPLPLPVDLAAYPPEAPHRGWFLTADPTQTVPAGAATLAYVFQFASKHYPLMTGASFALAKGQFDRARAAMTGEAMPTNKPTLSVPSIPRVPNTGLSGVGTGSAVQRQQIRTAGQTIHNLVPFRAVSLVFSPTPVSPPILPQCVPISNT